jgi:hypothetical protein
MANPTESLKEKLALSDFQAAVEIAAKNRIAWREVETWAKDNGLSQEFRQVKLAFCKMVKTKK